jgi:hypothetical protein
LRDFDPDSGQWLSYDPFWNAGDPNGQSFCGGDPVNGFDPNGKCVENTPPSLYFGVAPVMANYIETTTDFQNGTSATTGLPGQSPIVYDQSQVVANSYNSVTMQTGQYFGFVSQNPLPDNWGQTTVTPITGAQIEEQNNIEGIKITLGGVLILATGTEELAPELLTTEGASTPLGFASADQFSQSVQELNAALAKSGVTDASIGVRGSSVTGVSFGTGQPFSAASDIDFFAESGQLTQGLRTSQNIPGFVNPNLINSTYDPIAEWSQIWSENLGRRVSVGGFQPGTVPAGPVIRP